LAHHKQALKRYRQSLKARSRNRAVKSHVKNAVKDVRFAVNNKNKEEAQEALIKANSVLEKAATKGVIHWRNAARRISRLSHAVKKIEA